MEKKPNIHLIKQAVVAAEANRRQSTSKVKTRGEVTGGGKKPWRQKGTGRARAGSSRSPIWVGGGKVFGPTGVQNFKQTLPKQMTKKAIEELFVLHQDKKTIVIAKELSLKEAKTKQAVALLAANGVAGKRCVIITHTLQPELVVATRNLPQVSVVTNSNVSILDLAHARAVLIDEASAKARGLVKEAKPAAKTSKKAN